MNMALLVALGLAILYSLHRLGLWAERRGWIYYKMKHGSSGTLSTAVLEAEALLDPSKRHILTEKTRDVVEEKDSGDPPTSESEGAAQQARAAVGRRRDRDRCAARS